LVLGVKEPANNSLDLFNLTRKLFVRNVHQGCAFGGKGSGEQLKHQPETFNLIETLNLIEDCEYDPLPLSIVGQDVTLLKIEKLPLTEARKRGRDKLLEMDVTMDFKLPTLTRTV